MGELSQKTFFWGGSPYEDVSDLTVAIGDTYGDDVRGNDVGGGH